jgi:heavy metal sensor kinase
MLFDKIPVRLRLSIGHSMWMAIVFSGLGFVIFRYVERNLYDSLDAALRSSATAIRDARFVKGFGSPLMREFLEEYLGEKFIRSHAQLVDVSGRISLKTANDLRASLPVTPKSVARAENGLETLETFVSGGKIPLRQITVPVMSGRKFTGELILIAAPLDLINQTLTSIATMLWIAMPSGLILSILFGYFLTARSLKPVRVMSFAASRLGADELNRRLTVPAANDELRRLAVTFNQMLDRLEDAFMRLRRFSGDVSHELRTPLTVLRAEAELALRRQRSAPEYREFLENIARESVHMSRIVDDLLLLARANGGSLKIQTSEIASHNFCIQIIDSLRSLFEPKAVSIDLQCPKNINFTASPAYMEMVIRNLLVNAIKYSCRNSSIKLAISQCEDSTDIKVIDYGEGIPAAAVPYIFDPFYRVDSARNRAAGGTGIGLSLASALVKLHNGRLSVESIESKGSTFTVTLPRVGKPAPVETHAVLPPQLLPAPAVQP